MRTRALALVPTAIVTAIVGCSVVVDLDRFNAGGPIADAGVPDTAVGADTSLPDVTTPDTTSPNDAPVDTTFDAGEGAPIDAVVDAGRRPHIYVGGGSVEGSQRRDLMRAELLETGLLGPWSDLGNALPSSASTNVALRTPSNVYVLGPDFILGANTIRFGKVAAGAVTDWAGFKSLNTHGRIAAATNGAHLYSVGGVEKVGTDEVARSDVFHAPIMGDGTPGPFVAGRALPLPRAGACAVLVDGRIYVMGGFDTTGGLSTTVRANVKSDGTLDPWITQSALTFAVSGCAAVVVGKRIFVLGGYGAQDSVQHTLVAADGTLGPWITSAAKMPTKHAYFQAAIVGGHVVAAGGFEGPTAPGANVDIAPITEAGIGTWKTTTALPKPRIFLISFAVE